MTHSPFSHTEIQGNIARGYRHTQLKQLFGTIEDDAPRWKAFLSELPVTDGTWSSDAAVNVGISFAGLSRLVPETAPGLARWFPAFVAGMAARADALGDRPAVYEQWEGRHLWITIHGDRSALTAKHTAVLELARKHGVILDDPLADGAVLGNPTERLEHFGFRDGISNPYFEGAETLRSPEKVLGNGKRHPITNQWVPIATGEFLLGHVNEQRRDTLEGMSTELREIFRNGTFAVLRDLQQHVGRFRDYLAERAVTNPGLDVGACLFGRDQDGRALVAPNAGNDFDYGSDPHGASCPMGAHVRRANPRIDGEHRLLRRSIPYGSFVKPGDPVNEERRGIYFIAMNASLENQFEFLQRNYLNGQSGGRTGFGKLGGGNDPIGAAETLAPRMVIEGDVKHARSPVLLLDIPSFVTCHGGEYYLLPSMAGLRALGRRRGTEWTHRPVFRVRRDKTGVPHEHPSIHREATRKVRC